MSRLYRRLRQARNAVGHAAILRDARRWGAPQNEDFSFKSK
jgi:hypothetical protein